MTLLPVSARKFAILPHNLMASSTSLRKQCQTIMSYLIEIKNTSKVMSIFFKYLQNFCRYIILTRDILRNIPSIPGTIGVRDVF